jgi:phenylalanyl-tRNA synthetase alpha chain
MHTLLATVHHIYDEFSASLEAIDSLDALEKIRIDFLGRSGKIVAVTKQLKDLSLQEKRIIGPELNTIKEKIEHAFDAKKTAILQKNVHIAHSKAHYFDVTTSIYNPLRGSLHVYTTITKQLQDIFISMGYEIVDGPEIETDFYNFGALNIPADHPARDMQDTFWLAQFPQMLLRTHTSSVQVRAMQNKRPPFALFATGRVYRNEATDASHDFMFHQGEFLLVDKNVSMSNLLATTQVVLQKILEKNEITMRVRPGYFPFVEPGVEIDASCPFCKHGCAACKRTGWIELLGAGLIHPNVLKNASIDSKEYSGFACGFGITRIVMLKYGITDVRLLHSDKTAFLDQFVTLY